ncbi:hypothetical protein, variant [Saprolegnia diclina VS20]|uniref:Uncharacterized protein n=1 Tax=Saprolegnia diclina (strain VS20) TaxID=1156394 RepID=T0RQR2_SAPDV|nr:hypothetical protein, variant [Saprolegnia diclina VS20]EQC32442.1 hypothetical protein, variant [Saprolegnia diclina VS20]|eukprot:XP_008613943.1 hypothetical protein, variant [Saprolegnia diclina VS20]
MTTDHCAKRPKLSESTPSDESTMHRGHTENAAAVLPMQSDGPATMEKLRAWRQKLVSWHILIEPSITAVEDLVNEGIEGPQDIPAIQDMFALMAWSCADFSAWFDVLVNYVMAMVPKTAIFTARYSYPTAMLLTEHKLDAVTSTDEVDPTTYSSDAFKRGEIGGYLYFINERSGAPMVEEDPLWVEPNDAYARFIALIAQRCAIGIKFAKAGVIMAAEATTVGGLAPFPLHPSVIAAIEMGFEALKCAMAMPEEVERCERELATALRSRLAATDTYGEYQGLVEYVREDGEHVSEPKEHRTTPVTTASIAPSTSRETPEDASAAETKVADA